MSCMSCKYALASSSCIENGRLELELCTCRKSSPFVRSSFAMGAVSLRCRTSDAESGYHGTWTVTVPLDGQRALRLLVDVPGERKLAIAHYRVRLLEMP